MPCPVDAYPSALINLPHPGFIVPALQIVQPCLRVVDVSAVAQGVLFAEGCGQRAGGGQQIAPCVIGVARGDGSLRRFRQAVILIVGIARGVGRAVERLLLRGEVIVVVIAPRDAVCIPAAALLPAHQPILKIVEILRLASARAVCQQTEVAVVVVGVVGLRAVLIADGRGAAKAIVAIGHRIAVAVVGPRELVIAVRAVAVADERARARLNALHQIERAVGKAVIRARGRGNRREQVACVALNLKPLADILRQLSFEMCFKQVVCNHTFVNDYTMLACP